MRSPRSHNLAPTPVLPVGFAPKAARPDWFLQESTWHDVVWTFKPCSVPDERRSLRLRWDFQLPSGTRFTAQRYASLLESSRQLLALIRSRSLNRGAAQRPSTVITYFRNLRTLVCWMDQRGFTRFSDLDAQALLQFQRYVTDRPGDRTPTIRATTVLNYLVLFQYLYRFRDSIDDSLQVDPFPGRTSFQAAGGAKPGRWPHTPDEVAVALIQGAIDLVVQGAEPILRAREIYAQTMASAAYRRCKYEAARVEVNRALAQADLRLPCKGQCIRTVRKLAHLINMLYAACFVVIAYLVGARGNEILHLRAGCVKERLEGNTTVSVIVGAIFKQEAEYHGRTHEWVAPAPAIQAIAVLEALSASHRAQSGRAHLWLRSQKQLGATEWQQTCPSTVSTMQLQRLRLFITQFGEWLSLPLYQGKPWHLTSHQGRKTFARFVALRDRTALLALAQHLGHRERAITDRGYSGVDYKLEEEIEAEILEQSTAAWEHMLASPTLGGRAGAEIILKRPRFSGSRLKHDLKSYAHMLADAGLVLGVCDWGFCVYRENSSACLGNASGPNPARREPSTCARCKNFAVSTQHRSYWVAQAEQCERLLNDPALPLQTLRIARERMNEARALIRQIDGSSMKGEHGSHNER